MPQIYLLMTTHFDLTDDEFEKKFTDLSLDPELFVHEAHLRLAWIHINKYGVDQASKNLCKQIKIFDLTHGDDKKFHYTLTVASALIEDHFIGKSKSNNFPDFIKEFPRILHSFKDLLNSHYSANIFARTLAKEQYVEPDLLPF